MMKSHPRFGVLRDRLLERLRADVCSRRVFIHGQAGQGKSTLAAQHVHSSGSPCIWIDLNGQDRSPWSLCAKLFCCGDDESASAELERETFTARPSPEESRAECRYRFWARAFTEWVLPETNVVLDGLEALGADSAGLAFIKVLLRESQSDCRFVLLSRAAPPQWIQDMVVRGEADLLENDDLAFTLEDVEAFFRIRLQTGLSKGVWEKVLAETAGWPAGLNMLASLCDHLPAMDLNEAAIRDLSPRLREAAAEYFQQSVLSWLSQQELWVLIRCSLFEVIDASLARTVLQTRDKLQVFRDLCRNRVFLNPVAQDGQGLAYRLHPLFRAALTDLFQEELSEQEHQSVLTQAGQAYEEQDHPLQALSCYLQAKAFDQGISILHRTGFGRLYADHGKALFPLLDSFPQAFREHEPWLLFWRALATRFRELDANIQRLGKAESFFEHRGDHRGRLLALAFLVEAIAFRGRDVVPLGRTMDEAQKLLASLGLDAFPEERALLLVQLGHACATRLGQADKGYRLCQQAGWLASQLQRDDLSCLVTLYKGLVLVWCGDFAQAEELYQALDQSPFISCQTELQVMLRMAWAGMAAIKGDSDAAAHHVQQAQESATECGLTYLAPVALFYDVFLHLARKEHFQAAQSCRRLLGYAKERDNMFLSFRSLLWLGLTRHHQGAFEQARNDFEQAMAGFGSKTCPSASHLFLARILNGINAIHLQDTDYALTVFEDCLQQFEHQSNGLLETLARAGRALALIAKDRQSDARPDLEKVFQTLEQWKAHGCVFLSDHDLQICCLGALELKLEKAQPTVLPLLEKNSLANSSRDLVAKVSGQEPHDMPYNQNVCRIVQKQKAPRIEIRTMGDFQVLKGGQELEDGVKSGHLPQRLLKAIIARGGEAVDVSQLQEDIWPDCDTAHGRFKIALHRLRKALEPDYDQALGSTYLHLSQSRVSLDPDLISLDVRRFEEHAHLGGRCEDKGELNTALSHYDQALTLYRGPFLPEEDLAPWAENKRNALKSRYLGVLMSCARLHKQRGANTRAAALYHKVVEEDPLYEEGYRQLMILYTNMKLNNEALQVYQTCARQLWSCLGVDPDPVTVSLWKTAQDNRQ